MKTCHGVLERRFISGERNGAYLLPEPLTFPALKAIVDGLPRTESGRHLAPGGSRGHNPQHPLKHVAMLTVGATPRPLRRQ